MKLRSVLSSLTCQFWSFFSKRYLNPPFIRFTTTSILLISIINLLIAFWTSAGGRNIYGSWAGGDYSCFYVAGKILNEYPPEKLYDFRLQSELLHSILPNILPAEQLPFVNPPFFALLFKPLALMPFMFSYCAWMLVSAMIYCFGLKLLLKYLSSLPQYASNIAFLLAISFEPFLMETVIGGNSSSVAFLAFVLFLYSFNLKKDLISGFSLGVLFYKPTFLLLILPMIFIARRTKIILGFSICIILLMFFSTLAVGTDTFFAYMRFLLGASNTTLRSEEIFRTWKYVDIFTFFRLLLGTISPTTLIAIAIFSLVPIIFLMRLWYNLDRLQNHTQELLIASTITLSTIINLHFGIYDTVILVLSILLTANVLYAYSNSQNSAHLPDGFKALLVSIFILPWVSQHLARITGVQLFSVAIAAMGCYQALLTGAYSKLNRISSNDS